MVINMEKTVKIKCTSEKGAQLPVYKTEGAAGADICAFVQKPVTLIPGEFALIPTGLYFAIPEGYEVQVRPRSGLAAKNGVTVLNTPGTIDSDYRGEIKVILINMGKIPFVVNNGDRIAQIIVSPVTRGAFVFTDSLDTTERGAGGFGSTGVGAHA
jgi:dUTP pyrophosphatase